MYGRWLPNAFYIDLCVKCNKLRFPSQVNLKIVLMVGLAGRASGGED